jgi:hypothetical protein
LCPLPTTTPEHLQHQHFALPNDIKFSIANEEKLKNTIISISKGELEITTKNVYYWIAHYVFDDCEGITPNLVKAKIKILLKENGISLQNMKSKGEEESVDIDDEAEDNKEEEKEQFSKKRIVRKPIY